MKNSDCENVGGKRMGELICKSCNYENPEQSKYCQHCGTTLTKKHRFSLGNESRTIAGTGTRGISIAPLGGLAVEKQAAEMATEQIKKKFPRIVVKPLEDGTWYCPLCGDKNKRQNICKGCGFEAQL